MGVFKKYVDTKSVTNCAFILDVMVIYTVLGANREPKKDLMQ